MGRVVGRAMRHRSCFPSLQSISFGKILYLACGFPQENEYLTMFFLIRRTGSVCVVQLLVKIFTIFTIDCLLCLIAELSVFISKCIFVFCFSQCCAASWAQYSLCIWAWISTTVFPDFLRRVAYIAVCMYQEQRWVLLSWIFLRVCFRPTFLLRCLSSLALESAYAIAVFQPSM